MRRFQPRPSLSLPDPRSDYHIKARSYKSGLLDSFPNGDNLEFVKEAIYEGGPNRILYILDWNPSEDLDSGELFSGATGHLFINLMKAARSIYLKGPARSPSSWRACVYSAYKTVGKPKTYQESLHAIFAKRLQKIIVEYKPNMIVSFGNDPSRALIFDEYEKTGNKLSPWLGVPIKKTFKWGKEQHECAVIASISLTQILYGSSSEAALLGYVVRHLCNALTGQHRFAVDDSVVRNHKSVLINSISKFDQLFEVLQESDHVSIDTETENLHKVTNKLLTVQFAKCAKYGYCLPIYHKDTPFSSRELKYIVNRLRGYFEGDNNNKYHIYANAKFDLLVLRSALKTQYMHNDLWDIFGGEFALDENLKFLDNVMGDYYYSLLNLSIQYGTNVYLDSAFKKSDRGSIATRDLDEDLIRYSTYDVVVPLLIHYQQKRRAQEIGYKKYESVVTKQISDTIHGFTKMEQTGSGVDINYLFFLRTPKSPIEAEIKKMEWDLLSSAAVKKANKLLTRKMGVSSKGLFGDDMTATTYFDLSKNEHKQLLFFNVLKLEPLAWGVLVDENGQKFGKIDKTFQATYADVPEVAQFTAISKAKKLKNAYVKSFIKKLQESEDFRSDKRIRPNYHYLKVVTYRSSAEDPNLQQIPSRSELGKQIKRLFIARVGCLYVKVDYRVHEVRGWGIVSFDKGIAKIFKAAQDLWTQYRAHPTEELYKRLKFEADVHVVNALYFFRRKLQEYIDDPKLMKDDRGAVKGVTFGLIYQMSINSLAASIKQTVEYTQKLYDGFVKKFPSAMQWNENIKKFAQTHYYVEAPIGIRRNLWGYLLPKFKDTRGRTQTNTVRVHADMDRRAVNSPVQGFGAQCMSIGNRMLDKMVFKIKRKQKRVVQLYVNNSVHDSLENEAGYGDFILCLDLIERALTNEVKREIKERFNFDLISDLAIDFEIGPTLSHMQTWDFSVPKLEKIVHESLVFQRDELKYPINVRDEMRNIFSRREDMPKWMTDQIANLGFKFQHEIQSEKKSVR